MSFNTYDIEADAGSESTNQYKDFPEFESLSQALDNSLYSINNNQLVLIKNLLQQYESLIKQDNTTSPSTSESTRALKLSTRISELITKCTDSFKKVNDVTVKLNQYLNECESNHEDEDTLSYLRRKESILIKLIKSSLGQFQKHQRKFEQLQQTYIGKFGDVLDETTQTPEQTQTQSQQQVQVTYEPVNAEELEQQTLMIQEREREIHQITQDTTEINEIFQNLQGIIQEQQFSIDNIESNIINFASNSQGALNELRRAERYQRRAGGRMMCCLVILLGVLGSIILIGLVF